MCVYVCVCVCVCVYVCVYIHISPYCSMNQHLFQLCGWITSHCMLLLLSRFSRVRLCATPETAAHQAPPSLGFSRHEHWSGLPFPSPMHESEKWKWSRSVISDSSRPHGLQPTRLLRPWDVPGKSTGVGCHCNPYFVYPFTSWRSFGFFPFFFFFWLLWIMLPWTYFLFLLDG